MADEPILDLHTANVDTSPKVQRKQANDAVAQGMKRQRKAEQSTMRDMAKKAMSSSKRERKH